MGESFFATLECELLARRRFVSQAEARMAVFSYIEGWYNPARRHSSIRHLSRSPTRRRCSRKPNDLSDKPSTKPGQLQLLGYPVLLSVHDEIVAEVPEGTGNISLFERIMCTPPEWA